MKQISRLGRQALTLISVCSIIPIEAVHSQDLPVSTLTNYTMFRVAMTKYGWRPDRNYGVRDNAGRPMYKYAEVICGNSQCSAQWLARNGKRVIVVLWQDSSGDLRVAPQVEWPE